MLLRARVNLTIVLQPIFLGGREKLRLDIARGHGKERIRGMRTITGNLDFSKINDNWIHITLQNFIYLTMQGPY